MIGNATVSSRSSSSKSGNSWSKNSSMPSLRMKNPLGPKTSYNPLFRHSDQLTSFDASHFVFQECKREKKEKKRTILRRYNSQDSHTISEDVQQDSKDNTPDSTKSRVSYNGGSNSSSSERKHQEYSARDFLERYSLPRVIKVEDGEPLLLYRCFDSFTKVQAKAVYVKKGREKIDENVLHFPEGYSGWFSLVNEKGEKDAVLQTTILQLVREQVCSFLTVQPFTAYTTQSTDLTDPSGKLQYFKTQVRGGQLFQLRAVFQHKDREGSRNSTRSSRVSRSAKDKDLANRYAQLVSQTNQEFYVPLTTKGEFYEIHSSMKARLCFPGMLDKTGPLAMDKDCLYKITHLLRRIALPVKVRLMHGPLPPGAPKDFPNTFILEKKFQEPLLVTCTLPPPFSDIRHQINCFNLNSKLKITRCTLGFDSENRLFKSQRLQAALSFCHNNVENWYREVRLVPNLEPDPVKKVTENLCLNCKMLNTNCNGVECKQFDNIKQEDSNVYESKQLITKEVLEKFPKTKKWYKHFKLLGTNETEKFNELKDPMDGMEKRRSIDRYKDMSKLIEEKLGRKGYNPVKKSASFMFSSKRLDLEETKRQNKNSAALLKCQSLDTQLYSINEDVNEKRRNSKSSTSDNLSYDFQMCILDNEVSMVESNNKNHVLGRRDNQSLNDLRSGSFTVTEIDIECEPQGKLKKSKPDLIPTLPKGDISEQSYITERLCTEFHVKTKVQKKTVNRQDIGSSIKFHSNSSIFDQKKSNFKAMLFHQEIKSVNNSSKNLLDEIPYSHVADEVCEQPSGKKYSDTENIYAEICESATKSCNKCDNRLCEDIRTTKKNSDYSYVKLGSNGDSVTQSDSDEAIYNTLR